MSLTRTLKARRARSSTGMPGSRSHAATEESSRTERANPHGARLNEGFSQGPTKRNETVPRRDELEACLGERRAWCLEAWEGCLLSLGLRAGHGQALVGVTQREHFCRNLLQKWEGRSELDEQIGGH